VFAPQCLSTLSVVRRETNSIRYPLYMAAYMFALAYVASFITYRVALALGG
jgi:ferrous iron transport protein B